MGTEASATPANAFTAPAAGTPCPCQACLTMCAMSPPHLRRSFMDKLVSCIKCEGIYDPVPAYPPGAQLACMAKTGLPASWAAAAHGGAGGYPPAVGPYAPGLLDPQVAQQHLRETVRLAKLNKKAYKARMTAEMAKAKQDKRDAERARKAKEKDEAVKKRAKEREEAAKKAKADADKKKMAKFDAWARRNGCAAIPPPAPPKPAPKPEAKPDAKPAPPACCNEPHIHAHFGPPGAFYTAPAPQGMYWPEMSHTMMHAVLGNNGRAMTG